jgi:biopolymer transport protein ExbD
MNIQHDPDTPADINMVPMIDVIFAILTFFIVSTLFLTRSESLPVNLPQSQTSDIQQTAKITVTVEASGQLFLNQQPIQLTTLADGVRQLQRDRAESLVTINADRDVSHGVVVSVMDELRQIEGARIGIATESPEPSE